MRQLWAAAGLVVLILVMLNLNSRLSEYYRLSAQRDSLKTEVAYMTATLQSLQIRVTYANSDQAAEDYARSAHMVRTGEVLVVPLTPVGFTPVVGQEVTPTTQPVQSWEVWWALFFEQ